MVVLSKIESCFEQLLSETHAVRLCKKKSTSAYRLSQNKIE